jgi:hypothetical protein
VCVLRGRGSPPKPVFSKKKESIFMSNQNTLFGLNFVAGKKPDIDNDETTPLPTTVPLKSKSGDVQRRQRAPSKVSLARNAPPPAVAVKKRSSRQLTLSEIPSKKPKIDIPREDAIIIPQEVRSSQTNNLEIEIPSVVQESEAVKELPKIFDVGSPRVLVVPDSSFKLNDRIEAPVRTPIEIKNRISRYTPPVSSQDVQTDVSSSGRVSFFQQAQAFLDQKPQIALPTEQNILVELFEALQTALMFAWNRGNCRLAFVEDIQQVVQSQCKR